MSGQKRILFALTAALGVSWIYANWPRPHTANADQVPLPARAETAIFAGGCFWCMEPPFEKLDGVYLTESGYTGGHVDQPTYEQVSHSDTGHVEAVRVTYDPDRISYDDLLEVFWRQIDPTDDGGQFVDRGPSYVSGIFVEGESQRMAAEASRQRLIDSNRFDEPIVTPIRNAETFYLAEDYHQDFYKKSVLKYKYYRYRSGRDQFIDKWWGDDRHYVPTPRNDYAKPSDQELKDRLSELQYDVTQNDATEPAFKNEYWDNTEAGIYVDIATGEPLFSSQDKYKSGTGWPSFTRPIESGRIVERTDYKLIWPRTEIRSKSGDSHLGHVFNDGPEPTGLRYCLNSAALRFIPVSQLAEEGYGSYQDRFDDSTP